MTMATMDLHDLRMQEFPHNVRLALNKLEVCLQTSHTPQMALLQQRIVDEFVFTSYNAGKHKSNPAKVLSHSVNELILVRVLSEHLGNSSNPSLCNGLLLVLFHPSSLDPTSQHSSASSSVNNHYLNKNNSQIGSGGNSVYARPPPLPNMMGGHSSSNPYIRNSCQPFNNSMNSGLYSSNNVYGGLNPPGLYNNVTGNQFEKNGMGDSKVSQRLNILAALTSMAVATKNEKVLQGIAAWMQQVCCLSGWCGQVCKRLIAEYCTSRSLSSSAAAAADGVDASQHPLHQLPSVSPLFTTNLITCWAQLYARLGAVHQAGDDPSLGICRRPPLSVLRLIVTWLRTSPPSLLFTPLAQPPPLPPHTPTQQPTTAIAPLLRWCVEAPFFLHSASSRREIDKIELKPNKSDVSLMSNKAMKPEKGNGTSILENSTSNSMSITIEDTMDDDSDDAFGKKRAKRKEGWCPLSEERELYSQLHLCLLQALHVAPHTLHHTHAQVLCPTQVVTIVEGLIKLLEPPSPASAAGANWRPRNANNNNNNKTEAISLESKMEAVNRLAQLVLVASKTSCLVGSRVELWTVLRRLPIYNRLVKILLTTPLQ